MSVRITCIKKSNGYHDNAHVAISELGWINESNNQKGRSTRLEMYDFVQNGGEAYVRDWRGDVAYLITAISPSGTKYVKTKPDGTKADNLLTLPECN